MTWIWYVTPNITTPKELYYAPRIFDLKCLVRNIQVMYLESHTISRSNSE